MKQNVQHVRDNMSKPMQQQKIIKLTAKQKKKIIKQQKDRKHNKG